MTLGGLLGKCKVGWVAMKERWERFLTATQDEKSRLKNAPTAVESFMAQGVDAIDMSVIGAHTK